MTDEIIAGKIKSKKDAENFLNLVSEFTFEDSSLSCMNTGFTRIKPSSENVIKIWSFGQNWQDQIETELSLEEGINFVYIHRKDINQEIQKRAKQC